MAVVSITGAPSWHGIGSAVGGLCHGASKEIAAAGAALRTAFAVGPHRLKLPCDTADCRAVDLAAIESRLKSFVIMGHDRTGRAWRALLSVSIAERG
jgi:hypothetical protein